MQIGHDLGRRVFVDQLQIFRAVVDGLATPDFWAATRCRGWSVADVISHVHVGLQEMLLGVVSPTGDDPDTDAASYWAGSPADDTDVAADTDHLLFIRRLTAAHRSPDAQRSHLTPTVEGLIRGVLQMPEGQVFFQDRVLTTGDFFTIWAVELAIHHFDLAVELEVDAPSPTALELARQTVEALVGRAFPPDWTDEQVVLLGTGRITPQEHERTALGELADRLPVLG